MARNMSQKFLALQIVMVTFGLALFFALATLKQTREDDKVVVVEEVAVIAVEEDEDAGDAEGALGAVCEFPAWVGRPVDAAAIEAALRQKDGAMRRYRVVSPGAMMTMDYSPARVNIHIDENGIVIKVDCG